MGGARYAVGLVPILYYHVTGDETTTVSVALFYMFKQSKQLKYLQL